MAKIIRIRRMVVIPAFIFTVFSKIQINPPAIQAIAYISYLNNSGVLFSGASLITPPEQAVKAS
jgi:hypothetical protein